MSIDPSLLEKVRSLPPERQEQVVAFVESLCRQTGVNKRRVRLKGLCADVEVRITEEDIDRARREMWGGFPREEG